MAKSKAVEKTVAKNSAPGLGPLDKQMLRLAAQHKTLEEISQGIGGILTAAECGARITSIVEAQDWLSVLDQKRLLVTDAAWLLEALRKQLEGADWISKDEANTYRNSIKDMLAMIDNITTQDEATMMRISEVHAKVMAGAIRLGYERAVFELQKKYDIDEQEAFEALEAAVPVVFESLTDG